MVNPEVYGNLSFDKFSYILRGDNGTELSLMNERYNCLREAATVLKEKFSGMCIFFSVEFALSIHY